MVADGPHDRVDTKDVLQIGSFRARALEDEDEGGSPKHFGCGPSVDTAQDALLSQSLQPPTHGGDGEVHLPSDLRVGGEGVPKETGEDAKIGCIHTPETPRSYLKFPEPKTVLSRSSIMHGNPLSLVTTMVENQETKASKKMFERFAWVAMLVIGVVLLGLSLAFASGVPPEAETFERITGMTFEEMQTALPGVAHYIVLEGQGQSIYRAAFAITLIGIAAVPFRNGEKWAWFVLWAVPAQISLILAIVLIEGGMASPILAIFLVVAFGSLLVPFRKFFPKESADRPDLPSTAA